jgi:hypothetical protein
MKRSKTAAVGIAAFAAIFLAACVVSSETRREDELRRMAATLVPLDSTVIGEEPGGCVELAEFPSCVTVYFAVRGQPSVDERMRQAQIAAEKAGWQPAGRALGPGGAELRFKKGDFFSRVVFWVDPSSSCAMRTLLECGGSIDHVEVTRGSSNRV